MRTMIAAAVITAAVATSACGRARGEDGGPTVSRNYPVGNFDEIELAGRFDVQVRTGANANVSASGPEKLMERLEVEVRGNRLTIKPKDQRRWFGMGWSSGDNVQVLVTVPRLRGASLAGSGNIDIDKVQGDRFEGEIAGSGDLRLGSVEVGQLKLSIAGSGSANAGTGKAQSADYDIAGSGEVQAARIAAQDLRVSIAGSGDVQSHATGTAQVDIMGSGNVEVTGGAKCSVTKGGSGNVRCS